MIVRYRFGVALSIRIAFGDGAPGPGEALVQRVSILSGVGTKAVHRRHNNRFVWLELRCQSVATMS
jgi:hypothetical protein